jgi:hypothetical protein
MSSSLRPQVGDSTNLLLKKLIEATNNITGGGGIPDAPVDGLTYGRKDAAWIAIAAGYIDGEVQFYANLPIVVGVPPVDSAYLVREPSGVWLINYHPAGIYIRTGNAGSLSDWTYAGEFPDVFSDANFRVYNDSDPTKEIAFDVSALVGVKTAAWQNKNGTVAMKGDIAFSAQGGSSSFETLSFRNANGISFSNSLGSIEASYTVPSTAGLVSAINFSAGTTSQNLTNIVFSNSNGVTFGLNGSTMTGSHNGLTSQSNQAFSAQGGSSAFQTLSFGNSNGLTFSNSNGSVVASYTVPTTAGLISAINFSAGTTSNNLSALTFSNSNGISFGLNASTVTASYTVPSTAGLISAINFSAGTTSNNLSALTFSNSNGVTFGLNGSVVTASVAAGAGGAAISGGANSQSTGTVNFSNSNGVTFGLSNNGVMTASVASSLTAINFSAGTTSNNLSALTFSNSNGISFGLNASTVTASYTVPSTAGLISAINFSGGTTSNNVTGSIVFSNSNNVSFGINGSTITASVATSLTAIKISGGTTSNNLSALTFDNAGGITFGLNGSVITAAAPSGAPSPVNFSAGTTSNNLGSVVFSNSNNFSFGLNGSTITGSYTVPSTAGLISALNFSGGTTSNDITGSIVFSNSNGVSFGLNGSTLTASVQNGTLSQFWHPDGFVTTVGAPIVNSASFVFLPIYRDVSFSRIDLIFSQSVATTTLASTAGVNYSFTAVLLTQNGQTLNSIASSTNSSGVTWSSNNTSAVTGVFFYSLGLASNLSAGNYWMAFQLSTAATGNTLTGANTTSLANTITMMGVGSAQFGAFSGRDLGGVTASSVGWFSAHGMNSSTGNLTAVSISNITAAGTRGNRAALAIRFTA